MTDWTLPERIFDKIVIAFTARIEIEDPYEVIPREKRQDRDDYFQRVQQLAAEIKKRFPGIVLGRPAIGYGRNSQNWEFFLKSETPQDVLYIREIAGQLQDLINGWPLPTKK